jgi:hypothetical protein
VRRSERRTEEDAKGNDDEHADGEGQTTKASRSVEGPSG